MLAINILVLILMASPNLNYGAIVRINDIVAKSFPYTAAKQVSALCNNSFLANELEQPSLRK